MNKEIQAGSIPQRSEGIFLVDGNGIEFPVSSLPANIGRGEMNEITIDDDSLSEAHARIYYDERVKEICIEDLGSSNGIFVNQKPTSKNILFTSSEIRLGLVTLTFHGHINGISPQEKTRQP
jgi:pSer/pThr/pTyr-binding forkhead associated (FHA) protein